MANATKEQMPEVVAIFMVRLPRMLWALFTSYLRMKKQAKLAGNEFYRTLVDNGMPPSMARELRDEYCNMVSLSTIMKSWGKQK
ncbi:MAG: hypothetical protein LUQ16_07110 [Methanomassiliicoccales archaeon]|jgi:hypothetical protein|nr:hypothetical protein [Methanomassiliicoccales archaeon]MDD1756007.1 hypothetical protein [Methanomassiliicoccales archaeon]